MKQSGVPCAKSVIFFLSKPCSSSLLRIVGDNMLHNVNIIIPAELSLTLSASHNQEFSVATVR